MGYLFTKEEVVKVPSWNYKPPPLPSCWTFFWTAVCHLCVAYYDFKLGYFNPDLCIPQRDAIHCGIIDENLYCIPIDGEG